MNAENKKYKLDKSSHAVYALSIVDVVAMSLNEKVQGI